MRTAITPTRADDFPEWYQQVVRLENPREHYGLTLRCWLRNLERRHTEALAFPSEETYRVWRLYLGGSGHCFRCGQLGVYQTLLAKLDDTGAAGLLRTRVG